MAPRRTKKTVPGLGKIRSGARKGAAFVALLGAGVSGFVLLRAQETPPEYSVEHAECTLFGPQRDQFTSTGLTGAAKEKFRYSALTAKVTAALGTSASGISDAGAFPGGSRTGAIGQLDQLSLIDHYLFQAMQDANVTPAPKTNDFEFARRASLDLTGRILTADQMLAFTADSAPDKRAKLVDNLLNAPEWVDKWTMYFGDVLKNTATTVQVTRYNEGRNAFYQYIKGSLAANKPYDQMARELISASGANSYDAAQGQINWMVGGRVTGGPQQDTWDQQAADVAETYLGLGNMNCLLCHNGRGHLDQLNLWGANTSRYTAWQFSSFMSHTYLANTRVDPKVVNSPYYWSVTDRVTADYPLNTTTGNRPSRQPSGAEKNVKPVYPFSGRSPAPGENYRVAMAREVTSDIQFARASVNYIWAQFFTRGIVDPPNQFDLARLDPDNPPPDPWTLQPSNARLLNALAAQFVANNYDVKWLMRQIVNSQAYQLSSRYNGTWDPSWEKLFARKLVRRLWAEEVHDSMVQASSIPALYKNAALPDGQISWAMQCPEPRGCPDNGNTGQFLNAFLRGDREDNQRKPDASLMQALSLMNDAFVMTRVRAVTTAGVPSLLQKNLNAPDGTLVSNLYLAVLSRYPTDAEKQTALDSLKTGVRQQKAENLLWSLFNKVDFLYNY